MESDIVMYAAGYVGLRVAIVLAFASAFYYILRPSLAHQRAEAANASSAVEVRNDNC